MSLLFDKRSDAIQSLVELDQMEMLEKLIRQLNKDFSLSGIDAQFDTNWTPELIISTLNKIVAALMTNEFQKFINFLYRVDISEKKIGDIESSDFDQVVNSITFMILKKEWQKVWFRNRNLLQE